MKHSLVTLPIIFMCGAAHSDQNATVLGQLLIMDSFSRATEGKVILRTPFANLEDTLKNWQLMNPHKTCYLSPQYHSDGTATPRLKCH